MNRLLTQEVGNRAEEKAFLFLKTKGLIPVTRNYRCRLGEIDLIMKDSSYLVFIEVRARSNSDFGGGIASITYAKRQKIIKTTSHYLLINKLVDKYPIRFDVVSVDKNEQLIWIRDAFTVDY